MFSPPTLNNLLQIPENAWLTICTEKVAGTFIAAVMMFSQILQMKRKLIWDGKRKDGYFSFILFIVC